jgi:hypothetical protein
VVFNGETNNEGGGEMKKLFMFSLVFALTLALGFGVAFAGNGGPNGAHYNLNIIGVKDKSAMAT